MMTRKYRQLPRRNVPHRRWTANETMYLLNSRETKTQAEMACELGRTPSSVAGKLLRLDTPRHNVVTE